MENVKLPDFVSNILKNMWVSCSEKAAKALSEMINKKVEISSTSLKLMRINEVPKLLNPEDATTTIIFTQLIDPIKGVIILSTPLKNILKMADIFLHKRLGFFKDLRDENLPVIKEFASILTGYYITTLNELLEIKYRYSAPFLYVNPYRAIEKFGLGSVYKEKIYVLTFKVSFKITEEEIKKDVVLLFGEDSIKQLLEKISKKIKFDIE